MREKLIISVVVAFAAVGAVRAAEYELKWDTGQMGGTAQWALYGGGIWLGNHFDVSTLSTRYVDRIKIYSTPSLYGWDGYRIAIWDWLSMPPGIIWPTSGAPKFVKGYGAKRGWCEFNVGWTLPAGVKTFVAAQEQFFVAPYLDPYVVDDAVPAEPNTWNKIPLRPWRKYCPFDHTLMLRVIMGDDAAVAPTSLGRVKTLYR